MSADHDEIDMHARGSRLINFDPRIKLGVTLSFIVALAFMRQPLPLWVGLTFVLLLLETSGVPMKHYGRSYAMAFPFILFASLTLVMTSTWMNAMMMGMRISASVLALLLMVSTTPFFDTLRALRWYRVPPLMCNLMMFTYRFIFVLTDEMDRMSMARKARGFSGGKSLLDRNAFTTISNTIGMVFVRANQRAGHIYDALLARGYSGEVKTLTILKARPRDAGLILTYGLVISILVMMQLGVEIWAL